MLMGYVAPKKSPRTAGRGTRKQPYEKRKGRGRKYKSAVNSKVEEKQVASLKEVSEITLKRLHVLGNQRFGSSPFREHFDRWLMDLKEVLAEFELNPNVKADDQFIDERTQLISNIESELERRRGEEAALEEVTKSLSISKNLIEQIKEEYAIKAGEIGRRKRSETRRLYKDIDGLRKELDSIGRMKTGFFRGISKKDRERKETLVLQELNSRQRELELVILEFTQAQERLREGYETKRKPVIEQVKDCQKKTETLESDSSLEERWFVCESLVDAVNTFLQRKTLRLP